MWSVNLPMYLSINSKHRRHMLRRRSRREKRVQEQLNSLVNMENPQTKLTSKSLSLSLSFLVSLWKSRCCHFKPIEKKGQVSHTQTRKHSYTGNINLKQALGLKRIFYTCIYIYFMFLYISSFSLLKKNVILQHTHTTTFEENKKSTLNKYFLVFSSCYKLANKSDSSHGRVLIVCQLTSSRSCQSLDLVAIRTWDSPSDIAQSAAD